MRYISARERRIIVDILNPNVTTTLISLAEKNQVSVRTIRRDLASISHALDSFEMELELGKEKIEIIGSKTQINEFLGELPVYELSNHERLIVLFVLLVKNEDYSKYYSLQNTLMVSNSVLMKDLDTLNEYIIDLGGEIEKKRSAGIKLVLTEFAIRRISYQLIVNYLSGFNIITLFENRNIKDIIPEYMMNPIEYLMDLDNLYSYINVVSQFVAKNKVNLSDTNILFTALYISIIKTRDKEVVSENLDDVDDRYLPFLEALSMSVENGRDLQTFLKEKLNYDLFLNFSYEIRSKAHSLISYVSEFTRLPLIDDLELYRDVLLWFRRTERKAQEEILIDTHQTEQILNEYPSITSLISDKLDKDVTSRQLAELLMLFISRLEEIQHTQKFRVLVICIGGMGSSRMIVTRLKNFFPNLELVNISIATLHEYNKEDYDFVISTVSIGVGTENVVKVSPLLFDKDIQIIKRKMRELTYNRCTLVDNEFDNEMSYSTMITLDHTIEQDVVNLLKCVLAYYEEEYFPNSLGYITDQLMKNESIGFGIPGTDISIFHARSSVVERQLVTFVFSQDPITVKSMTQEEMQASIHIVMISTDEMTQVEKLLFNTVSILITRNEKFRKLLQSQDLSKIIKMIEDNL